MTRKLKYNIILCVNILLIIALVFSTVAIVKTNEKLADAKSKNARLQTAVVKQEEIAKEETEKSEKLQSELEKSKKENKSLKDKNSKLEKQLAAKKKNSGATSTVNKKPATLKPVPQNPMPVGRVCYLTFDDGPTKNTLKILKILDKYDVKATFFVIDTPQTKIEYVKQIHAAGHTVGLHSNSHNYSRIYKSTTAYFNDLNKISNTVKKLTGVESKVIRFPGGGSNTVSRKYCRGIMSTLTRQVTNKGYTYFDWNISSGDADAATVSATKIKNNVLNGAKNANSACVLMHDAASKTTTVEALPKIIEGLKKQGYVFKPLTKDCYGYHHGVNN